MKTFIILALMSLFTTSAFAQMNVEELKKKDQQEESWVDKYKVKENAVSGGMIVVGSAAILAADITDGAWSQGFRNTLNVGGWILVGGALVKIAYNNFIEDKYDISITSADRMDGKDSDDDEDSNSSQSSRGSAGQLE